MHYAKKSFLMIYIGTYDSDVNVKIYNKEVIFKFNYVLSIAAPMLLFYLLGDTK